jgi:hypothetical protein
MLSLLVLVPETYLARLVVNMWSELNWLHVLVWVSCQLREPSGFITTCHFLSSRTAINCLIRAKRVASDPRKADPPLSRVSQCSWSALVMSYVLYRLTREVIPVPVTYCSHAPAYTHRKGTTKGQVVVRIEVRVTYLNCKSSSWITKLCSWSYVQLSEQRVPLLFFRMSQCSGYGSCLCIREVSGSNLSQRDCNCFLSHPHFIPNDRQDAKL